MLNLKTTVHLIRTFMEKNEISCSAVQRVIFIFQ